MNRVIFGEGEHLHDPLFIFSDEDCDEPFKYNQKAIDSVLGEMKKRELAAFHHLLDATHLDYSWPSEMSKFYPFDEKIDYIDAAIGRNGLEKIKNHYGMCSILSTIYLESSESLEDYYVAARMRLSS